MFCTRCGAESKDDASFCWKCGKPFSEHEIKQETQPEDSRKWEFCEIVAATPPARGCSELSAEGIDNMFGVKHKLYFEARVVGPKGSYVAASFKFRRLTPIVERDTIVAQTISQLTKEGWVVVAKGNEFYQYQLRRPFY